MALGSLAQANPLARDADPVVAVSKAGSPGALSATVTASTCDGTSFALASAVADTGASATVTLTHTGTLFPPGAECSVTVQVRGSSPGSGGNPASDSKTYSFVTNSDSVDRVIVLTSKYNYSPVVYVRQDDGSFKLHVPKVDFAWTAGNCLVQKLATSMTYRAISCKKIGEVDPNWYTLALSSADWTLSASAAQVAKLGSVPAATDSAYWADVFELVANPTPQLAASAPSKTGTITLDGFGIVLSFHENNGAVVQFGANFGNVKLFVGW